MDKLCLSNPQGAASVFLASDAIGKEFTEKYTLQHELGEGGNGFALSAYKNCDNLPVAVKFFRKRLFCIYSSRFMVVALDPVFGYIPLEAIIMSKVSYV